MLPTDARKTCPAGGGRAVFPNPARQAAPSRETRVPVPPKVANVPVALLFPKLKAPGALLRIQDKSLTA